MGKNNREGGEINVSPNGEANIEIMWPGLFEDLFGLNCWSLKQGNKFNLLLQSGGPGTSGEQQRRMVQASWCCCVGALSTPDSIGISPNGFLAVSEIQLKGQNV